jgi:hypothetical protein
MRGYLKMKVNYATRIEQWNQAKEIAKKEMEYCNGGDYEFSICENRDGSICWGYSRGLDKGDRILLKYGWWF